MRNLIQEISILAKEKRDCLKEIQYWRYGMRIIYNKTVWIYYATSICKQKFIY